MSESHVTEFPRLTQRAARAIARDPMLPEPVSPDVRWRLWRLSQIAQAIEHYADEAARLLVTDGGRLGYSALEIDGRRRLAEAFVMSLSYRADVQATEQTILEVRAKLERDYGGDYSEFPDRMIADAVRLVLDVYPASLARAWREQQGV